MSQGDRKRGSKGGGGGAGAAALFPSLPYPACLFAFINFTKESGPRLRSGHSQVLRNVIIRSKYFSVFDWLKPPR